GIASIRRAIELEPGASEPQMTLGIYLCAHGRVEEGRPLVERALELDPLDPNTHLNHARIEDWCGNHQGAREALIRTLELSPDMAAVYSQLGIHSLRMGRGEEALAEIARETSPGYRDCGLAIAYHVLGNSDQSTQALERLISHGEEWGCQIAQVYAE